MARYFYDHSVGETISQDSIGVVCRDEKAAVRSGWIALAQMLTEHKGILPWQHFELIIRREDGANVGRLGMTVVVETLSAASATAHALQKSETDRMSGLG